MDFGRRVRRHADPTGPACSGVYSHSVLRFASGFFPTRPHGASASVSRRQILRAVASSSRLLPSRPAKDFHLQSSAHARHTYGRVTPSLRHTQHPANSNESNPAERHLSFAESCSDNRGQRCLPLRYIAVKETFDRLVGRAGIVPAAKRRPRLHDLRHTFAVRALQGSPADRSRSGAHMVALATYMGHVNIYATYWYLEATAELMRDVAAAGDEL